MRNLPLFRAHSDKMNAPVSYQPVQQQCNRDREQHEMRGKISPEAIPLIGVLVFIDYEYKEMHGIPAYRTFHHSNSLRGSSHTREFAQHLRDDPQWSK
jgi:hypothetical protein